MLSFTLNSRTIASYFPEGESIYNNDKRVYIKEGYEEYIPVVDYSAVSLETDLDVVDINNRERSVKSYNKNKTTASLRKDIVEEKKIDLTANDLSIGNQVFVLNFTNVPINIVDEQGIPKVYLPISNSSLKSYLGKIIIFEINRLNTVEFVSKYGGIDNYLSYFKEVKDNLGLSNRVVNKLADIVDISMKLYDKIRIHHEEPASNSIKVINMSDIRDDYIGELLAGETIFVEEYNFTMSIDRSNFTTPNPVTTREYEFQVETLNVGDVTGVRAYINDPFDEITDRYICIGDAVVKIKKTQDPHHSPKFSIVIPNDGGKNDYREFKLEEIDTLPFVFKTKEEARLGMHKDKVKEVELSERKLELEKERVMKDLTKTTLRSEVDEKKLTSELEKLTINKELEEIRQELERQKANFEREKMDWEREKHALVVRKSEEDFRYDLHKAELERERELMKLQIASYSHDRSKENETLKFQQDLQRASAESTLQTLKVVGGVAALGVAAFTLYKKLS